MISNAAVRSAEWIIKQVCQERIFCYDCPHYDNCAMSSDDKEGYPIVWGVPAPPPEPTERQRIEWLRMLPDGEMLDAVIFVYDGRIDYNAGPIDWWHEVVSLEQFRKDAGLG